MDNIDHVTSIIMVFYVTNDVYQNLKLSDIIYRLHTNLNKERPYLGVFITALLSQPGDRHQKMGLALAKVSAELLVQNTEIYAKAIDGEILAEIRDKNQVIDPSIWHHLLESCRKGEFQSVDEGREKCGISTKSAPNFYRVP